MSKRYPASRQLTMEKDAGTIADYMNPAFVLNGWIPKMAPLILRQPEGITVRRGETATISVSVAAVPEASYQWFKNDMPVKGATMETLTLKKISTRDAGAYNVTIKNNSGTVTSRKAILNVE